MLVQAHEPDERWQAALREWGRRMKKSRNSSNNHRMKLTTSRLLEERLIGSCSTMDSTAEALGDDVRNNHAAAKCREIRLSKRRRTIATQKAVTDLCREWTRKNNDCYHPALIENLGDPQLIEERKRLGSQHLPHIVLTIGGTPIIFANGAWSQSVPRIEVFDDAFVAANVCSGMEIETEHRQNLHELILGERGVALNAELQTSIDRIEKHNRDLKLKQDAISTTTRGTLTVDEFCDLVADVDINARIIEAARAIAAAKAIDAVQNRKAFEEIKLPSIDVHSINALLARNLLNLEAEAAARVKTHLKHLGKGGEAWVGDGLNRLAESSASDGGESCPFCAQNIAGLDLVTDYQTYFSEAYRVLKEDTIRYGQRHSRSTWRRRASSLREIDK